MKWAINHRDEHVRADAPGVSYSFDLRCPVCRERVFPRSGRIREAHFAHYGGNFSKACEQYHPAEGMATGSRTHAPSPVRGDQSNRVFGAPELLWKAEQSLPTSLCLRLPSTPSGFASNIKVISRATSQFRGKELAKPTFAALRLQVPPGHCETTPHDPGLNALINETLSRFKFSGNYFRATSEGGVLEPPDAPLELGEVYWLVTQVALREPVSQLLQIHEQRFDRAWFVYRLGLPLFEGNQLEGLKELKTYLQRDVVTPRPRVNLIWPTPDRFDPDGIPVFDTSVAEVLVRSTSGVPECVTRERLIESVLVAEHLFSFRFDGKVEEALISVGTGVGRRLRFESCQPLLPAGVWLHAGDQRLLAIDPSASELLNETSSEVRVEVPSQRLWRNVRVNGTVLRPIPDGVQWVANAELMSLQAGSFGEMLRRQVTGTRQELHWFTSIERLVVQMTGKRAMERLRHVKSRYQLHAWVCDYHAQALLPKLLSLMSAGVVRDVS